MRKLNGLTLISALILACTTASAQQMVIKIDDQPIPSGVVDSITIDPLLNEVNITTTPNYMVNYEAVGDDVAITSFAPSSASVVAGDVVTFSWQTSNADSCDATGGVDGWAATGLPVNGSRQVTTQTVGLHTYTLECAGLNGPAVLTAQVETLSADAVAITSFTASPDSITVGNTTTISWNTVNAETCTPSGGTADWTSQNISVASGQLPSGSATITLDSAGTYTFYLNCTGPSGDTDTEFDSVTVSPDVQSCDSVTLSGNTTNWSSFWNASFPGPSYQNVTNQLVSRTGYLAIEFNTGNVIDDGKISALENSSTPGIRVGSISQCPGDFTEVPAECTFVWGLGGGIRWATNGKFGACDLESNTTYYFNITFTDGEDPNSTSCNTAPCRINLQHVNL